MKQKDYLFYSEDERVYESAKRIYEVISPYLPKINSVVDIGCGMAAFSKVFQESGVEKVTLIDHPNFKASNCLVKQEFQFIPCNLDKEIPENLSADLLICTEVLEHITKKRSLQVLDFITSCSDIIIFSAAIPRQGGLGHINEQRHEFWIKEFKKREFDYADLFKTKIINDESIFYWLRQNIFIFFKNQPANSPLKNAKWLGENFEIVSDYILTKKYGFSELVKLLPKAFYHSIKKRLNLK